MVRAGAIAKKVIEELEDAGCDIANGCDASLKAQFAGRTIQDYYTEGKLSSKQYVIEPENLF